MEKTIRIDGKDYKMKSSAYTQFAYKNETGRGLLSDIMDLQKLNLDNVNENVDIIDKLNATVQRLEEPTNPFRKASFPPWICVLFGG